MPLENVTETQGKTAVVNNQQVLPTDTLPLRTRRPQPCLRTDVSRQKVTLEGNLRSSSINIRQLINFARDVFLLFSFLFLKMEIPS